MYSNGQEALLTVAKTWKQLNVHHRQMNEEDVVIYKQWNIIQP